MSKSLDIERIISILNNVTPTNVEAATELLSKSHIISYVTTAKKLQVGLTLIGTLGVLMFGIIPMICDYVHKASNGTSNRIIMYWSLIMMAIAALFPYTQMNNNVENLKLPSDFTIPNTTGVETALNELLETVNNQGFNVNSLCFNEFNDGVVSGGYKLDISIGGYKIGNNNTEKYNHCIDFEGIEFKVIKKYIPKIK